MKRFLFLMALLTTAISNSVGQSPLNLPKENPEKAQEHYVLLKDHFDQGNYPQAYASLKWIITNAPDMHESVYIIGQKTLKKLIASEQENEAYKNELMEIYDMRINYFANEINVLNRKAFDAFKYFKNDPQRLEEVVELFDYLHSITGNNMADHLLLPYFELKLIQLKRKDIDEEALIKTYQNIGNVVRHKTANGDTSMEKIRSIIDGRLVESIDFDCERIRTLFVEPLNTSDNQEEQVRLIIKLSLNYGCTGEDYFVNALKELNASDPSLKISNLIASWYLEQKQYSDALIHLEKSKSLTNDAQELSDIYRSIAQVHSSQGNKAEARKAANVALQHNPKNLDCHSIIGDLYFNSYEACKKGISRVEDRSVFYAAYEKYRLAGDKNKMAMAEQQFPSMEVIHQENYEEGQVITSTCWTAEKVKIRRRPDYASN